MIKLSRQTDYAIQLILCLHKLKNEELLSLKKFSKESTISFLFLQKIAKKLREAGIVTAVKGKHGGYSLLRPATTISLKEVVAIVDGPIGMTNCTRVGEVCEREAHCAIKPAMQALNEQLTATIEKVMVGDMIPHS